MFLLAENIPPMCFTYLLSCKYRKKGSNNSWVSGEGYTCCKTYAVKGQGYVAVFYL